MGLIGGLRPWEDDPLEIAPRRIDLDVAPYAGFIILEAFESASAVSFIFI